MQKRRRIFAPVPASLLALLLAGCLGISAPGQVESEALPSASTAAPASSRQADIERVLALLAAQGAPDTAEPGAAGSFAAPQGPARASITAEFLAWCCEEVDPAFAAELAAALEAEPFREAMVYERFGVSLLVLNDLFTHADQADPTIHRTPSALGGPAVLAFAGDVNLADDWWNMLALAQRPGGLEAALPGPLLPRLRAADVLLVNNEFCFSERGSPTPGKRYTFRAHPGNVEMLHTMGVDLVSLGNNHVFDFGADAFHDTLATLAEAGIPYVGAGRNLQEAQQAQYFLVGGLKVAFVAASRAEKYVLTPPATASGEPGVLYCYDPADFLQAVETAAAAADIVVAYPHWGTENTTRLEAAQVELGHALIDAGATLVVGAHPHVLQGIEFYSGGAIAYSLGNFWFNAATGDAAFLEVTPLGPGELALRLVPCGQAGGVTWLLEDRAERQRVLGHLAQLSAGAAIDEEGNVRPQPSE